MKIENMSIEEIRAMLKRMMGKSDAAKEMMGDKTPDDMSEEEMRSMLKKMADADGTKDMMAEMMNEAQTNPPAAKATSPLKGGRKGGRKFEESIEPGQIELLEAKDETKGTRRIRINELVVANVVNGNRRLYEPEIIEAMIADWQSHLHESAGQGRLKVLTGEADHPTDKGKKRTEYLETVVRWDKLDWNGKRLDIEGDLILTSKGKDVEILMEAGVRPGGSIRGIGESKVEKVNGQKVEKVLWLSMNGVDLVGDPSFKNAA